MAKSLRQRRHKARILAMQAVFQLDAREKDAVSLEEILTFNWMDYQVPEEEREFARKIIRATVENLAAIDDMIKDRLVNWELERISPVSRAVLRTGVAQLLYLADEAEPAVIIDECILLAKQYDAAETVGFVNGLLDDVARMKDGQPRVLPEKPAPLAKKIIIKRKPKKE